MQAGLISKNKYGIQHAVLRNLGGTALKLSFGNSNRLLYLNGRTQLRTPKLPQTAHVGHNSYDSDKEVHNHLAADIHRFVHIDTFRCFYSTKENSQQLWVKLQ